MYKIINEQNLVLGTCYYPEHWPKEIWEEDLRRMLDNGIEVIRVAEFAWRLENITSGYMQKEHIAIPL